MTTATISSTAFTLSSTMATLASTPFTLSSTLATLLSTPVTLSSTPVTRLSMPTTFCATPLVTFRSSAVAIRASSCVNLSSLFSASSRSVPPKIFFTYFSEYKYSSINRHTLIYKLLTRSGFLDLLRCNPENRQYRHQYLNNYIHHFCGRGHPEVDFKTSEKGFYALEDVDESISVCLNVSSCLRGLDVSMACAKAWWKYALEGGCQFQQRSPFQVRIPINECDGENIRRIVTRRTRPTPSPRVAEKAYNTLTVGFSHFDSLHHYLGSD